MKIEEIDRNFRVSAYAGRTDIVFRDCKSQPFSIHGVMWSETEDCFVRMPQSVAEQTSPGVAQLNCNTAGGRVRFCTDSEYIAIRVTLTGINKMPHFALTGSTGFDLTVTEAEKDRFVGSYIPPFGVTEGYTSLLTAGEKRMRQITIHFPLYCGVRSLEIGVQQSAELAPARPYAIEKPVLYYDSSITQGGCASRPANAYPAMLSQWMDCDHINLGFSGSACGEPVMADYIAGLDCSVFVYDYDNNAPTAQHLLATHEPLFLRFRKTHPHTPVIVLSRPKLHLTGEEQQRKEILRATAENARKRGDRAVEFLDGSLLFARTGGENATVDNSHPNDLGFFFMAEALVPLLRQAFSGNLRKAH